MRENETDLQSICLGEASLDLCKNVVKFKRKSNVSVDHFFKEFECARCEREDGWRKASLSVYPIP